MSFSEDVLEVKPISLIKFSGFVLGLGESACLSENNRPV